MSAPTVQTLILHGIGDACLPIKAVAERIERRPDQVTQAAWMLIRRGLLKRIARGCFQLTRTGSRPGMPAWRSRAGPRT